MIERVKTKKSLLFRIGLFSKNHPVLLFAVLAGCFLLAPSLYPARAGGFWDIFGTTVGDAIRAALYGIYQFCSSLVTIAAALFTWVIDAKTFTSLMNDGAIYEVWVIIRDFCNIFFILVLLFSAFATIFQLDKYEYKKTIPMLVLMALLVNFSFPISRVVIDLANVPMYFFAQNVFGTGVKDISSGILKASTVSDIILPGSSNASSDTYSFSQLLTAIVCMFLLGISFFVLAILMLVRMIALVILVMFSPIGFVGLITPALQGTAKGWWDKLFKWAFYGPISVMFVLIAIIVMQTANKVHTATNPMKPLVGNTVDDNFIATIAYFAVPIVLFWIAITSAEKYSNEMSGMSIKWGSNFGRWMGKQVRRGAVGTAMYIPRQSGIAGGIKQAWQDRMSGFKESREKRERAVAGVFGGDRARARVDQENKKLTDEAAKKVDMANLGDKKLRDIIKSGNKYEKAAALTELAERGNADRKDLANMRNIFGKDSQVTRGFEAKMRAFDPVAVFTEKIDPLTGRLTGPVNADGLEAFVKSNKFDPKKLSADSLTPELLRYAFKAKNISTKDLDELRSKGGNYVKAIDTSLDAAIKSISKDNGGTWNMTDDIQRNIQSAYLAQTGKFHASMDSGSVFKETDATTGAKTTVTREAAKGAILARADANTLKRAKNSFIGGSPQGDENLKILTERMAAGKYADILLEMEKGGTEQAETARLINEYVKNEAAKTSATANQKRLDTVRQKDHRISHIA